VPARAARKAIRDQAHADVERAEGRRRQALVRRAALTGKRRLELTSVTVHLIGIAIRRNRQGGLQLQPDEPDGKIGGIRRR
jgi:hypothetical protein